MQREPWAQLHHVEMLRGAIVAESLRIGATVEGLRLIVHKLERVEAGLGGQPRAWTILWFEAEEEQGHRLAQALSASLQGHGGWYADFHSESEVTVVFADRVFRYRRGDSRERTRVTAYARSVGVPEPQLDWTE
jgi:hypothetical protein